MLPKDWIKRFSEECRSGHPGRLTLSKFLTLIENENPIAHTALDETSQGVRRAYRLGVTGPPGAGKSTLVNALVKKMASQQSVAIIAVDPTSPFSGGAILGDRVRMNDIGMMEGVFVRSIASRGAIGGLARTTQRVADVLDVAGYDIVLIETMGVGQSEVDISRHADTVIVTIVPESGDGVQAMKAGLMEIADVFVLNKSDRAQADQIRQDILTAIQLRSDGDWLPPVVKTVAIREEGIEDLMTEIDKHRNYLAASGLQEQRRKKRIEFQLWQEIQYRLVSTIRGSDNEEVLAREVAAVHDGRSSLHDSADRLLGVLTTGRKSS